MTAGQKVPQLASITQAVAGKVSKEMLGYDFFGLITKLAVLYIIAYLLQAYLKAVIVGGTALNILVAPLGIRFDKPLPDNVVKFFHDGLRIKLGASDPNLGQLYISLNYWDFVNTGVFLILFAEALKNFEDNKKLGGRTGYITLGVWGLLLGGFSLAAFANYVKTFQDSQKVLQLEASAIQKQQSGDTRGALADLQGATAIIAANPKLIQVPISSSQVTP